MCTYYKTFCLLFLFTIISSCLEPYDFKTESFESALVIEATITNEVKRQEINLSRTFRFEEEGPTYETGANVQVTDNDNTVYNFTDQGNGLYLSNIAFSAQVNKTYTLSIETSDGRFYSSEPTPMTAITPMESVEAVRQFDDLGNEVVAINVNSYDPTGSSTYYRYVYEETYKIIAPNWSSLDAILDPSSDIGVSTVPRTQEERVCYKTVNSNTVIITDTNDFEEDRVTDFSVKTIAANNYIITHRYSILVKQYIQSAKAYYYYQTLRDFSGSESIFSQNQPGFFNGNVFSNTNSEERVVGFFDVSSVDIRRIYFNYEDLFPGEELPPFPTACELMAPELYFYDGPGSPLSDAITSGSMKFVSENGNPDTGFGFAPYIMVFSPCGDCTELGSNVVPDFWED